MKKTITLLLILFSLVACKEHKDDGPLLNPNFSEFGTVGTASSLGVSIDTSNISLSSSNNKATISLLVQDSRGRKIKGDIVRFRENGITLGLFETNEEGVASFEYLASGNAGSKTITAQVFNESQGAWVEREFTINVIKEYHLEIISGNNQTATVGQNFSPFQVQVINELGEAVQGVEVSFSNTAFGNYSSSTANTNSSGLANVILTGGATVVNTSVQATIDGTGLTSGTFSRDINFELVDFKGLSCVIGNNQTIARNTSSNPIICRVVDGDGNGISGVNVSSSAPNGSFASAVVATDVNGYSSFTYNSDAVLGLRNLSFSIPAGQSGGVSNAQTNLTVENYQPQSVNLQTSNNLINIPSPISNVAFYDSTNASIDESGALNRVDVNSVFGLTSSTLQNNQSLLAIGDLDLNLTPIVPTDNLQLSITSILSPNSTGATCSNQSVVVPFDTLGCGVNETFNFFRSEIGNGNLVMRVMDDKNGSLDFLDSNSLKFTSYSFQRVVDGLDLGKFSVDVSNNEVFYIASKGGVQGVYYYNRDLNILDRVSSGGLYGEVVYSPSRDKFFFNADNLDSGSQYRLFEYDKNSHQILQRTEGRISNRESIVHFSKDNHLYFGDYTTRRKLHRYSEGIYEYAFGYTATNNESSLISAIKEVNGCLWWANRTPSRVKLLTACDTSAFYQATDINGSGVNDYVSGIWGYGSDVMVNATDSSGDYRLYRLVKSGTTYTATQISNKNPSGDNVVEAKEYNGKFYFILDEELLVYDGTTMELVKDLNPSGNDSVEGLEVFDNKLFFGATINGDSGFGFIDEDGEIYKVGSITGILVSHMKASRDGNCLYIFTDNAGGGSQYNLCK